MHMIAFFALQLAFVLSLFMAGLALFNLTQKRNDGLRWLELGQGAATALMLLASLILLYALVVRDFSFSYVASYTDTFLPMFYTVTAFWAGQDGSLLFWGVLVAFSGLVWMVTPSYRRLPPGVRVAFWLFFCGVQAFFLYLLTGPSNPFIKLSPAPMQGNGLNPLLQHPGMIFHPPLLFIGYAGFTVPACIALAMWFSREQTSWLIPGRNWLLVSWIFLTAGIILGAWWSYMELGWGGYWAWDPVENASLIPWLSSSALLHTAVLGRQRKALGRSNLFLMALTLVLCLFATYLVRSGVIDSLHAFGSGGVGGPLLAAMAFILLVTLLIAFSGHRIEDRPLSGLASRQGMLLVLAWLLLAIGAVVLLGTMWPVISRLWSSSDVGLDAGFYNRVCLPLFALFVILLTFCPWVGWKSGTKHPRILAALGVLFFLFGGVLAWLGITRPLPLVAAAISLTCLVSIALLLITDSSVRRSRKRFGAYGVHFGMALIALGIAISGPYQVTREAVLSKGESLNIDGYTVTYTETEERVTESMAAFGVVLEVSRDGRKVGRLSPERRVYRQFDQPFAEVSVIPGLGDELYATLLGISEDGTISLSVRVNPLVNWIWIGGTLVCVIAFLTLGRRKEALAGRSGEDAARTGDGTP